MILFGLLLFIEMLLLVPDFQTWFMSEFLTRFMSDFQTWLVKRLF